MFSILVEWLDEDRSRARFALPGRLEWRAEHLTALINALAEIRSEMTPAVPEEAPPPHQIEPLHAPRYATGLHPFSGGTVLEFRHPSLGWLEFVLPSFERTRISRCLEEQEAAWRNVSRK